jgi:hypothetical protein
MYVLISPLQNRPRCRRSAAVMDDSETKYRLYAAAAARDAGPAAIGRRLTSAAVQLSFVNVSTA